MSEEPKQNLERGLVDRKTPSKFIAGRLKAALLLWFFGEFSCGVLIWLFLLYINMKIDKNSC